MTFVPHLFVRATIETSGRTAQGVSADGLTPKWFTKDAATTFEEDDLPSMQRVIQHAADLGIELGWQPSVFAWWWQLYQAQQAWAHSTATPPLLAGFGVSLIERAVIDAACRDAGTTLFRALSDNLLAIELAAVRPSLGRMLPSDVLPRAPRQYIHLRHTVGLADPLDDGDISNESRLNDGLPHALRDSIREYGLRYFKVKLQGHRSKDRSRLKRLVSILHDEVGDEARLTLDGNEQYGDIQSFREAWEAFVSDTALREFFQRCLLFVEQPVHRSHALSESVQQQLLQWKDAPRIIIDESDGDFDSLPRALELGYAGTSHKNCKGIIKGLAALATMSRLRRKGRCGILSAEDLGNVGPVALLQDLAIVAALGIDHVERNGHHYFAGLSMFSRDEQKRINEAHPDLYKLHEEHDFVTLAPHEGRLKLASVNRAPFGVAYLPDMQQFTPWTW